MVVFAIVGVATVVTLALWGLLCLVAIINAAITQ